MENHRDHFNREDGNLASSLKKYRVALKEIASLCREMTCDLSIDEVLNLGNKTIYRTLSPDLAAVYLVERDRLTSQGECRFRENSPELKCAGECLCCIVAQSGRALFSKDIHQDSRCTPKECKTAGLKSVASIPLISRDKTIGVLVVGSFCERDFEKDSDFLEVITAQLASGLEKARFKKKAKENKARIIRFARQVKRAKGFLQEVFDGIPQPLVLYDQEMTVLRMNKAASEFFRVKFEDKIGKKCGAEFPQKRGKCRTCEIPNYFHEDAQITYERRSCMDAERVQRLFVYPVNAKKRHRLVRFLDVTEQKLFEERLIQHEKLSAVGLLAAGITHEIKNPISLLTVNIPILRQYLDEILERILKLDFDAKFMGMTLSEFRDDIFQVLDIMEHGAGKIDQTVSSLQDFNRPSKLFGKERIVPEEVANLVRLMCRNEIKKKVRDFQLEVDENIGSIYMESNVLESIMLNLLINAIQALEKPDSRVAVKMYLEPNNSKSFVLEVCDNGIGIAENDLENIFKPFFTTKERGVGTGLGLYLCKKIVDESGGRIEVHSEPGEGTTVVVALPVSPETQ